MKYKPFIFIVSAFTLLITASCNKDTADCLSITCPAAFLDIRDGNTYKATAICNQCWMAENLRFIPKTGSYCYDDKPEHCETYGRFYAWQAIYQSRDQTDTTQGICPDGWHLPDNSDFEELREFLGGHDKAGESMKSTSILWLGDGGGNNSSGFDALPSGYYDQRDQIWKGLGGMTGYWSVTEDDTEHAFVWWLMYNTKSFPHDSEKKDQRFSVRCLMNR